jgi:hypothetical protein
MTHQHPLRWLVLIASALLISATVDLTRMVAAINANGCTLGWPW